MTPNNPTAPQSAPVVLSEEERTALIDAGMGHTESVFAKRVKAIERIIADRLAVVGTATLSDDEHETLMGAVVAKMVNKSNQVVPVVESILAARLSKVESERDELRGRCICNTGPGTDGPDETCPNHGRQAWYERDQAREWLAEVEAERDELRVILRRERQEADVDINAIEHDRDAARAALATVTDQRDKALELADIADALYEPVEPGDLRAALGASEGGGSQ